jgi:hypothetical protein
MSGMYFVSGKEKQEAGRVLEPSVGARVISASEPYLHILNG